MEELTKELQRKRAERLAKLNAGETVSSEMSSVPPSLADDDQRSLSSEGFLHTSQLGEGGEEHSKPKRNKTQLWNEVKITCMFYVLPFEGILSGANRRRGAAITRSFTLIYTLTLLTIFTRIQLNLLGRRNYLSSVISLATPPENQSTISLEDHDDDDLTQTLGNDFDTNRRYLAFSWWLLHRGWRQLLDEVRGAVEEAFGSLNPREDISLSKLSELTVEVRKKVEGSTEQDRRYADIV